MRNLGPLGVWLSATISASAIASIRVADTVACPTQSALEAALHDPIESDLGTRGLEVSSSDAEHLTVKLLSGAGRTLTEKTINRKSETCADLTQTIVLLVASWTRELDSGPTWQCAAETQAPLAAPPVAQVPYAGEKATVKVGPPPEPRFSRLALYLAIQGSLGEASGVGGTLGVDFLPLRWFALGAEITWMGTLATSTPPGTAVSVDRQLVTLLASLILVPGSPRGPSLSLMGGLTILHYSGSAAGYPAPSVAAGWEPGWMLGLRGAQPIFDRFFIYGEVTANAVANTLHFQAVGETGAPGTAITQPAFWPSLALGLGMNLF